MGRYQLVERVASGGMGVVYLARLSGPRDFARKVAVKVTHPHLAEQREFALDLLEEAKLASLLRHENTVGVLEAGEDGDSVFLVMDYEESESLSGLLGFCKKSGQKLPDGVALRILLDALAGLHAAHELLDDDGSCLDLVHRDFSPQNILVTTAGTAKLTDFGVAKANSRLAHTATGLVKGKTAYMSPEQARGRPLDRRSDLFAAGIVAWECFAGARFRPANNDAERVLRLVGEVAPLLRTARPDAPIALEAAIAAALTIQPEDRVANAKSFAEALECACRGLAEPAEREVVAAWVMRAAGERIGALRERFRTFEVGGEDSGPPRREADAPQSESSATGATRLTAVTSPGVSAGWINSPRKKWVVVAVTATLLPLAWFAWTSGAEVGASPSAPLSETPRVTPAAREAEVTASRAEPPASVEPRTQADASPTSPPGPGLGTKPVLKSTSSTERTVPDVRASATPRADASAQKPKLPKNPY